MPVTKPVYYIRGAEGGESLRYAVYRITQYRVTITSSSLRNNAMTNDERYVTAPVMHCYTLLRSDDS